MNHIILRNNIFQISIIFFIGIFITGLSSKANDYTNKHNLNFKRVLIPKNGKGIPGYVKGKDLFPKYSSHGLPDSFLIKKKSDIAVKPKEIKSITIERMPYVSPTSLEFQITLNFRKDAAERIYNYTKKMDKRKVALEINNNIFYVAEILAPIKNKMILITFGEPFSEVYSLLTHLNDEIKTKNIKEEKK